MVESGANLQVKRAKQVAEAKVEPAPYCDTGSLPSKQSSQIKLSWQFELS